jgi:hypothetical protein
MKLPDPGPGEIFGSKLSKLRWKLRKRRANPLQATGILFALLFLLWGRPCLHAQVATEKTAADFYVAPNGSDRWSGKLAQPNESHTDGPFATFVRARDAVRALKKGSERKDFVVRIRGGLHRLEETLIFSLEDGASNGGTVTYAAYADEIPILSSGVPIQGWRRLANEPQNLPAAARGNVWVADVPPALGRFFTLYDGLRRLPRARGEGFAPPQFVAQGSTPAERFAFPSGTMRNWPHLTDAELLVIPSADYEMCILPIASVDEKLGIATTAFPASRAMGKVKYYPKSAWVENLLEFLDQPGEWVLNATERKVYLWPPGDQPGPDLVAPALTELVRVEGSIDDLAPKDEPVKGLILRGLTFSHAERFQWRGQSGWSLQHHWEMFDRPTAAVRLRGAEGCVVQGCRFIATSGTALRLDLHCQRNRVLDNEIAHVGAVGVLLAGYGPGTKDVNTRNEVLNNWIHHTGEIYWATPAVMIWQSSENHVANNLIHNTPYSGITLSARTAWDPRNTTSDGARTVRWTEVGDAARSAEWYDLERFFHARKNLVERNEMHDLMEMMGDGNGVYISGAGGQNKIRQNFIHDCDSDSMNQGIRCDDFQNETWIEGNILHHIRCIGQGITSKGVNHVLNNIIVDILPSRWPIPPERLARGYIGLVVNPVTGSRIERNIIYARRTDFPIYVQNRLYGTGPEPRLRECKVDNNLYYCSADEDWGCKHLQQEKPFGIELHSLCSDPRFVDLERGDLRLKADSPAWALGFQAIETSKIGLEPGHPYYRP